MLFEYVARYADGHVALVSDATPSGARERARLVHPASPLIEMRDGWGATRWRADHDPYRFRKGWSRGTLTHAAATPVLSACGVFLATVERHPMGGYFDPDLEGVCRKCAKWVRR